MEFLLPGNCPASLRPTAAHLWKTFRSKLNAIPVDEQNCSPSHRNHVHLPTGMLFGITTEWRSASDRNRVHLRPDSPIVAALTFGFCVTDLGWSGITGQGYRRSSSLRCPRLPPPIPWEPTLPLPAHLCRACS